MTADSSLLFVVGADRPDQLKITGTKFKLAGSTDLYQLLGAGVPYHRLQMTPNYFRQARRPELDGYRCVLNLITEPEQNSRVLENLRKLLRGLPAKVVNHPDAVRRSTRDQIARRLAGIPGLHVPKAIRVKAIKPAAAAQAIERAGLTTPLIVRFPGLHTGKVVGRFDDLDEAAASFAGKGEHIVTEFVDFRSGDGVYRKYRIYFIGDRLIFRHMIVSDGWNVHSRDRVNFMAGRPELIAEEKALFDRPDGAFPEHVHATLNQVRERMDLDFFGMDFGIGDDGKLILFEANATMNFFPPSLDPRFEYWQQNIPPARQAFRRLLGLD